MRRVSKRQLEPRTFGTSRAAVTFLCSKIGAWFFGYSLAPIYGT